MTSPESSPRVPATAGTHSLETDGRGERPIPAAQAAPADGKRTKPLRPLVHATALGFLESQAGIRLRQDLIAWCRWRKIAAETRQERARALEWHLAYMPEFRTLFDYRAEKGGMPYCRDTFSMLPRSPELHITTPEIGGGLRIQHGHGTWINAERIGRNAFINQNVTIGQSKGGCPSIGDDVWIRTGAVVVGAITIGDNVRIGPNAVVDFDVPSGSKVFAPRSVVVPGKRSGPTVAES